MNHQNPLLRNWQQFATAPFVKAADAPTAEDIEKVFATQAYSVMQQKAPRLMEPQCRIGFEIVYKNSPTNSRLVGMFGFRLNGKILYVPCFFLSGQIKGVDLLHRVDCKLFVPLTDEWVEFLDSKDNQQQGEGVSRGVTGRAMQTNNLDRIAHAPTSSAGSMIMFKGASVSEPEARELMAEIWKDWETKSASFEEILPEFIKDVGDKALIAIEKAASDFRFAEAMHCSKAMDRVSSITLDPVVKSASAIPLLQVHTGMWQPGIKSAAEDHYTSGFSIDDARVDCDRAKLFEFREGQSLGMAGIYDILSIDDEEKDVLVLNADGYVRRIGDRGSQTSWLANDASFARDSLPGSTRVDRILVTKDGKTHRLPGGHAEVMGVKVDSDAKIISERLKDKPTSEGKWLPVMEGQLRTVSYPIAFSSVTTDDGITELVEKECNRLCGYDETSKKGADFIINPDTNDDWNHGIFGRHTKWLKVSADSWTPLPVSQFTATMRKLNHAPATVTKDDKGYLRVEVKEPANNSKGYTKKASFGFRNKVAAAACLADKLNLHGDDAVAIVDHAEQEGRCDFLLPLAKCAHTVRLVDQPNFVDGYNSTFGVLERDPQTAVLRTSQVQEPAPQSRIGDGWNPAQGAQILLTKAPMELYEFAQSNRIPALFDHAVVGSLAKTFDAGSIVDKYVPKLEEATDALGRMLFLLYWKPDDFKSSYGGDDLQAKENEILSNFKSLGSITLELLKRRKDGNGGTAALTN